MSFPVVMCQANTKMQEHQLLVVFHSPFFFFQVIKKLTQSHLQHSSLGIIGLLLPLLNRSQSGLQNVQLNWFGYYMIKS